MAGGIIQLLAYGAEDVYFTNNPQITFFKIVYRRHTNFSSQVFENNLLGNPRFGKTCNTKIYRLGDLINTMFLRVTVSSTTPNEGAKFAWVKGLGLAMLNNVRIEIGGQIIDRQYGEWINIWLQLARSGNQERALFNTLGNVPQLTNYNSQTKPEYTMMIPLLFWFVKYPGLSLPMISLQYHEVYIYVDFNPINNLVCYSTNYDIQLLESIRIIDASLLIEYFYLELSEREKFATYAQEYLIEQVQYFGDEPYGTNHKKRTQLYFNHPIKELFFAVRNGNYHSSKRFLGYTDSDNWKPILNKVASDLLNSSIQLLTGPAYEFNQQGVIETDDQGNRITLTGGVAPASNAELYTMVPPYSPTPTVIPDTQITVINNSKTMSFWINTHSLQIGTYKLMSKIGANIDIDINNNLTITNLVSYLTERDISIPISDMEDTRLYEDDVIVNQFNNFGLLISGKYNPLEFSKLEYNDQDRIEKRNGKFFGTLQPYLYHGNTPSDGINLYSFAEYPEQIQPSGVSNLSRVEKVILTNWMYDTTWRPGLPELNIINPNNRIIIFCLGYNILRIMTGLAALVYPD